jgi:uncharacterized protein YbjT (DUF2867 family)
MTDQTPLARDDASRRVFQIGAGGGVGRRLGARLVGLGHDVTGMHRSPEQAQTIRDTGASPVVGDLIADSVERLHERLVGHDAVVFSAGAHGTGKDKTTAIDGEGLRKAADAAAAAGVRRFVLVSVFMDALRDKERSEGFEHYMAVKRSADVHLAASDLDWLIVRPGDLLDEPGTGSVNAGIAIPYGSVSRDDVAGFIVTALFEPQLNRVAVELTSGDVPIRDAVAALFPRPWKT